VSSLEAVVGRLRRSSTRASAVRYLLHAVLAAGAWILGVVIVARFIPLEQVVRVAPVVPAVQVAPVVRVVRVAPAVPENQAELVVPENPVEPVALVVPENPAVPELETGPVAALELVLVQLAVALRTKSVTAAHHPGLVPVPMVEDSAAVAETTRAPVAAEAAKAWAAAE